MVWTNNQIYSWDPVDWSLWLFTLLSLSVTASLVMFFWNRIRKAVDDGGHTGLIYRLLKTALVFQLVPFSTILVRLLAIAETGPEGETLAAFFPTPVLIYTGRLLAAAWVAGILVKIGRLSQEMLYYMLSRGLDRHEAELLVTRAKLNSVRNLIKDEQTHGRIQYFMEEAFK